MTYVPFSISNQQLLAMLSQQGGLVSREAALITSSLIRNSEELLAVLWNFPGLAKIGIDFAKLSNAAAVASTTVHAFQSAARAAGFFGGPPPTFGQGAAHPSGAAAPVGFQIPIPIVAGGGSSPPPPVAAPLAAPSSSPPAIDLLRSGCSWPVRDQGQRGTCVAFATTACYEHFRNGCEDLSEQFLYWAIKVPIGDPWPNTDGTLYQYAQLALANIGICSEALWNYNPVPMPGNVSQQAATDPSSAARADAVARRYAPTLYQTSGGAAAVLTALQSRQRPVGISVPVFVDSTQPQGNNWNTAVGVLYGRVIDPPPTSIVDGGHAVCITGFQPDPSEPLGGWFILRNSWGTSWGTSLPVPGYFAPEIGYGQISATYVDKYLWEILGM